MQIVEDFTETVKRDRLVLANYAREQASQTRYTRTLEDRAREQARQTRYLGRLQYSRAYRRSIKTEENAKVVAVV